MSKRKRLDPARLLGATATDPERTADLDGMPEGLETKAVFPTTYTPPLRAAAVRPRAPIADQVGDSANAAALNDLSQALGDARREGRLIQRLPLDAVDETYLVRDRLVVAEDEMDALCDSLRARGQQSAIEVVALNGPNGLGWGLISGWRRLMALRRLRQEDPSRDSVLAIVRRPQEAGEAYLAMVEENEIRVGLSFYERARIVARAVDKGVYRADRVALAALFHAVPRSRRSKIGGFVRIVRSLDEALQFPAALSERAGLALSQALETDADLAPRLKAALAAAAPPTAEAEARVIATVLREGAGSGASGASGAPSAVDPPEPPPQPVPQSLVPPPDQLRPGLICRSHADGRLTLSGPALEDPAFRAALVAVLRGDR